MESRKLEQEMSTVQDCTLVYSADDYSEVVQMSAGHVWTSFICYGS
ncbi:hypothetical protein EGR_11320 [Echinococcus granulosus]|uniref:Uncharacterized protein n=1 Tax=Echinococcus granulosus TaxID=6210 RepID=W6UJZ5_ECHGR|nr:hypothetical protein EGR_11320 [Echinococcus granulosus]EUB53829.1 hypothetical protein EGR_11320 [Echinococcus granulosus]